MKKKEYVIAIVVFVVVAIGVGVLAFVGGKHSPATGSKETVSDAKTEKWQEGVIEYNGKHYKYNNHIKSYLFMGIDKSGVAEEIPSGGNAGQSDVLFLLVQDKKNETLSLIAINRNTMAEIDTYDINNNKTGSTTAQICLQHSYGDGARLSCGYTVDAVSRLFYDIPISGYYSMNMDGISILNDAVGGITVDVLEDLSDASKGVNLHKGDTVTLTGKEAYVYIRSRDVDKFNSATDRLERQKQYIEALVDKTREIATGSKSEALSIYDQISDYSVTNMSIGDLVYELKDYTYSGQMYSLPGEMVEGAQYEEYNVDPESLYQMVIDIFYEEVDQ